MSLRVAVLFLEVRRWPISDRIGMCGLQRDQCSGRAAADGSPFFWNDKIEAVATSSKRADSAGKSIVPDPPPFNFARHSLWESTRNVVI
jgi:hypothetical protein